MLKATFSASSPSSLADAVEQRLLDFIRERGLVAGDPLPHELTLAEELEVSRNVLREALSRLRMLGLVESRKRRGMVLTRPEVFAGLNRVLRPELVSPADARNMFELRLVLELGLAELLFARLRPADKAELTAIVEQESHLPAGAPEQIECDIAFHATIYRCTGNQALAQFQELLVPFFTASRSLPPELKNGLWATHADILATLDQNSPDQYRAAMRSHLGLYFQQLSATGQIPFAI